MAFVASANHFWNTWAPPRHLPRFHLWIPAAPCL